jgi:tetratricopeptide (TPR) repeat protein
MLRRTTLAMIAAALYLPACSTVQSKPDDGKGQYNDSVLTNFNPAPAVLTPPNFGDPNHPVVDTVHMGSQADYHFTLGEALSFDGQSEKAIEEFKLTLVYDATSPSVRLRLAAEYVRSGMVAEAVEHAEAVVKANPTNNDARMFLGGLYTGMKMYDAALEQFRAVLAQDPVHTEASLYLGAILAEQKDYEGALHHFEALIGHADFTERDKAYLYIGKIQVERGAQHFAAAEQAFRKGLAIKPENSEIIVSLGNLFKAQGHEDKMIQLYKTHQDKYGPDREIARTLSRYYLEKEQYDDAIEQLQTLEAYEKDNLNIKIQISLILIEQKQYERAASELEEILAQAPELDKVRYYLAAVYEELIRKDEAVTQYLKIPSTSSYYVDGLIHAAHISKEKGRADQAAEIIKSGLEKRDDAPQLFAYYATLLDEQKLYQEALAMLLGAVDKFPLHAQLRFYLGSMYDRLGKTDDTILQMKKVIEIDHDNVQALNYLAFTYAEKNRDLDDAEGLARHALTIQPKDGYILDTVGWVLFKKGKTDEAIRFLERAYQQKSDESIIAEHLGDAYLRYEMWQKALRMYRKAADLETDGEKSVHLKQKVVSVESQQQKQRSPNRVPSSALISK